MPLDVDAQSQADVDAAQDLAGLESELEAEPADEAVNEAEADVDDVIDLGIDDLAHRDAGVRATGATGHRDAGELYGVHTPAAADREHPDDDRAYAEGQNWLEALETSAIEGGAEPERELTDIIDDEDILRPPHASDARDTPVADHGAGGRRGL